MCFLVLHGVSYDWIWRWRAYHYHYYIRNTNNDKNGKMGKGNLNNYFTI